MTDESPKKRHRMPRRLRLILSAVALIFIVEYLVIPQFSSARKALHLLRDVNPVLLLAAVVVEALAIASYSEMTRVVLTPHAPRRFDTYRVNLSTLGLSHVIPGGTAPASALLRGFNPVYGFAALASVFLMLAFFGTIILITRGQRHADVWLRAIARRLPRVNPDSVTRLLERVAERIKLLTENRVTLWSTIGWASANWLLDAASLWIFIFAFGTAISPIDLLVAFGLANILAVVPITPAGLGIIEGTLIPTLVGFGVPHNPAILAVLAYRFINFWLPIPLGGFAYMTLEWRKRD